jgi:alkanesulfonate monooxygenase SsuD/methylene tetrahydromethanopterin reductase-like flavin-dependent oxidoreductase (luciferase family)
MEIGLHVVSFSWAGGPASIAPTLAGIASAAEEAGVSHLSFMDHWFQMEAMAPATEPMLEGYTSLGFMAAQTSTIRLGLLVTGVTYRHPGLLAKTVATLDVLSGGRGELGISASKRRCRSASRCGAITTGRSRVATTSSTRRSANHARSRLPALR